MTTEEQRAKRRDQYARCYPIGLKRKRDAKQREKQRVSQRNYELFVRKGPRRNLSTKVKLLSLGKGPEEKCKDIVGCTRTEFIKHLRSTMVDPDVPTFRLCYHLPLRGFNMHDPEQAKKAYHYTNIYAVESGPLAALRASRTFSLERVRQHARTLGE